jgi:4-hydroxybutyrate dehydrogenase/sulfolactaldehyde 3-reductase
MVDAPVGRTSVEAEKGESLFMVGAEECDFKIVQPILGMHG